MQNEEENKVVLIGESGVGKTCIINQFMNGKFNADSLATLSTQFFRKNIVFSGDKNITLDIWDTAGQEMFRSLNRIFYSNSKVVVLVYDVTNKKSFDELKNYWWGQIKENCNNNIIIALAANKCDLYEQRQVSDEEGEEFAESLGALFASTSAKNDSGITKLFEDIASRILDPDFNFRANEQKKNNHKGNENVRIKIDAKATKKKKKCCK